MRRIQTILSPLLTFFLRLRMERRKQKSRQY
jgi:hypothetical protein